eukprot:2739927-Amphidinium_carterae.2
MSLPLTRSSLIACHAIKFLPASHQDQVHPKKAVLFTKLWSTRKRVLRFNGVLLRSESRFLRNALSIGR